MDDLKSWRDGTAEKNPKFKKMEWRNAEKPKSQDGIEERRKNPLKTVKDGMTEIHPKS